MMSAVRQIHRQPSTGSFWIAAPMPIKAMTEAHEATLFEKARF